MKIALPTFSARTAGLYSLLQLAAVPALAGTLSLSDSPLFLSAATRANVLMLFGNSNSMDSDATGKAVGSANANSKSEIARAAVKSVIAKYTGEMNMGLMAYQQNALVLNFLHDSQYDVSYNPVNHDAAHTEKRNSLKKRFSVDNPTSAGDKIFYNINLPFYSPTEYKFGFCYSSTACTSPLPAHDFRGSAPSCTLVPDATEVLAGADTYNCYAKKTGAVDGPPTDAATGYSSSIGPMALSATDSDLGQGITDFGKQLTWYSVGKAWFNNDSPGKGYIHVPVAPLDAVHAAKLNVKLGTQTFGAAEKGTDPAVALQNGGLSPLEGAVLTANHYFNSVTLPATQGGPVSMPASSCSKNFLVTLTDGLPSVTMGGVKSSNVVANLAALRTQVADLRASTAKAQTYVVGYALPFGVSPTQLDDIASAGGSGTAYAANDKDTLNAAFSSIFGDIIQKSAASSAVALNSQSVPNGARVYQAKFNPETWAGQLLDYELVNGLPAASPSWDAGAQLKLKEADARVILSTNSKFKTGVAFRWPTNTTNPTKTMLTKEQILALNTTSGGVVDGRGELRLQYLRGSAVEEGTAAPKFRSRGGAKLGDMVNSAPRHVGAPDANYRGSDYAAFRKAQIARTKMVYVGANDGMLHGFAAATGEEKIAYVPTGVFGNLSRLTEQGYVHRYFVDGSPMTGDVKYNNGWHTVLVGSMGAGGRGIFALDVTTPANFLESKAKDLVNFEFTDKHDDDVGFIPGPVSIVKMNNGRWAALFGNGYNSGGTGQSTLFVVDIENGDLIAKISTGEGSPGTPNALAAPFAIDEDNDLTVDVVYAGDQLGNMWRFDMSAPLAKDWKVSHKVYQASQPITSRPDVGDHPDSGYLVYFGTGKFVEKSDVTSAPGNTMYGIWDRGEQVTGDLRSQTLTDLGTLGKNRYRQATKHPIDWAVHKGWIIDMPNNAERMISPPALRSGRVIFTSILPSGDLCKAGGSSWINEVDWQSGGQLPETVFDTDDNGKVNNDDTHSTSIGYDGITSSAAIQQTDSTELEIKISNDSSGELRAIAERGSVRRARRLSWRQIK